MKKTILLLDTRSNRRKAARASKKRLHGPIIILTSSVLIHAVTAVLDLPEGNADRGVRAKEIVDACGASTYVTVDPIIIGQVNADITAYNAATPATRPNL
jgi:hypothetical protein